MNNTDKHIMLNIFFFVGFLLLPLTGFTLSTDRDKPIDLIADTADIDDLKGISIYSGNVILTQGTMELKADILTLYHDKNRDLEKAVAEGKSRQVTFKQRPDDKDEYINAKSYTMIYYLKNNKVHFINDAILWQAGDSFRGDKIIYDTKKDSVKASSKQSSQGQQSSSSNGRIHVTIQPKKSK